MSPESPFAAQPATPPTPTTPTTPATPADSASPALSRSGESQRSAQAAASRGSRVSRANVGAIALQESRLQLADGSEVAVVYIAMPCLRDHQASLLEQRLRCIAESTGGRLAVSLSEVTNLNSATINALIVVHNHCRNLGNHGAGGAGGGGHLALFALSRELHRLFKVTHLDRTIPLADDVKGALQSFESGHRRRWSLRGRAA
jgi:anti-anti-sigma regulatory factor